MTAALPAHPAANASRTRLARASSSPVTWSAAVTISALLVLPAGPAHPTAASGEASAALKAFARGEYDQVLQIVSTLPADRPLPRDVRRAVVLSYARMGRPEEGVPAYERLGEDRAVLRELSKSMVTAHLRDSAEHVRITGYATLAEIAEPVDVPVLEDGLLDPSVLVRSRVVEGLGRLARIEAVRLATDALLQRAVQDAAPAVRIAALNGLAGIRNSSATELLTRLARAEEGPLQIFALAVLAKQGRTDALAEVRSAATLPDPETRMAAFGVLGRLKSKGTLSVLSQGVYDPVPAVRAFAAGALGEFGDAGAAAALMHALSDETPRVRGTAAVSLGQLGIKDAKALLWAATRDRDDVVRTGAVEGLLRLGEEQAVLVGADLAKHNDPSVRAAAAQALAAGRGEHPLTVLKQLAHDRQPQPRLMAMRALGRIRNPAAIVPLTQALKDGDAAVRVAAAGSLVQLLRETK